MELDRCLSTNEQINTSDFRPNDGELGASHLFDSIEEIGPLKLYVEYIYPRVRHKLDSYSDLI